MPKEKQSTEVKEVARVRVDNTPTTVKNMAKWLRECLYLVPEEDGKARFARVVCSQLVKGNKRGEEAFSLDVPKKAGDEWPDNAASEIYGKLQLETATLGGLQKYVLYAFHTGDNERHTSRFVVKLQGIEDEEGEDLDSEGTGKDGQIAQQMRHSEASARIAAGMMSTMVTGFNSMIARQSTMLERQAAMIETLKSDRIEGINTMRLLSDDAEEREIRLVQSRAKAKGVEKLVDRLGLLLPAAVNKIAGRAILPDRDPALMMMVKGLFTSLASNEEKMKALAGIMGPEEAVAFMNILEEVSAKDENGSSKKSGTESKG
jgi:hypothetical protein